MTPRDNKRFAVPTRLRTAFLLATYSIRGHRHLRSAVRRANPAGLGHRGRFRTDGVPVCHVLRGHRRVYAGTVPDKVRFRCVDVANTFAKLLTVLMQMIVGWMLTTMGSTSIFIATSGLPRSYTSSAARLRAATRSRGPRVT